MCVHRLPNGSALFARKMEGGGCVFGVWEVPVFWMWVMGGGLKFRGTIRYSRTRSVDSKPLTAAK